MRGQSYDIYGARLRVETDDGPALRCLIRLLEGFSPVGEAPGLTPSFAAAPAGACLALRFAPRPLLPPETAALLFHHGGLRAMAEGGRLWLTDGWSRLSVDARNGQALGELHPGSWSREGELEERLLPLGLLELLRGQGRFPLQATALIGEGGALLVVGGTADSAVALEALWIGGGGVCPGEGTVLLRSGAEGVTAGVWPAALRADPLAGAMAAGTESAEGDGSGKGSGKRGRARLTECRPTVLLFPILTAAPPRIEPLGARAALADLVPASPLLLTHPTPASSHLAALQALVGQCHCYRLFHGPDLRRDAAAGELLRTVAGPI